MFFRPKQYKKLEELAIGDVGFGGDGSQDKQVEEQETEVVMRPDKKCLLYPGDANQMM